MNGMTNFSVKTDANGTGQLVLNGVNVSDKITGYVIQNKVGEPPVLAISLVNSETEIEGVAIVKSNDSKNESHSSVIDFLSRIDPQELSDEVLSKSSFAEDPIYIALQILMERANKHVAS
jgi:hypothetical protein